MFLRQFTGAFERISCVFYVKMNLDSEVASLLALEVWISTSPSYLAVVAFSLRRPSEEFLYSVWKWAPGLVRTWKPEHYFNELLLRRE